MDERGEGGTVCSAAQTVSQESQLLRDLMYPHVTIVLPNQRFSMAVHTEA